MTAIEYIKEKYYIAKNSFGQIYEEGMSFEEYKTRNYIITSTDIGHLLIRLQQSTCIEDVDKADRLFRYEQVLEDLLHNCIIERVKPRLMQISKDGYGFNSFEYSSDLMTVLQFLEGYLNAQTPKSDVIYWIELGVKLNIINVTIEVK